MNTSRKLFAAIGIAGLLSLAFAAPTALAGTVLGNSFENDLNLLAGDSPGSTTLLFTDPAAAGTVDLVAADDACSADDSVNVVVALNGEFLADPGDSGVSMYFASTCLTGPPTLTAANFDNIDVDLLLNATWANGWPTGAFDFATGAGLITTNNNLSTPAYADG